MQILQLVERKGEINMDVLIAFFMGCLGGAVVMAFMNGCTNNKLIEEAYMEGFIAGNKDKEVKK